VASTRVAEIVEVEHLVAEKIDVSTKSLLAINVCVVYRELVAYLIRDG
jgi:hypothetical protein